METFVRNAKRGASGFSLLELLIVLVVLVVIGGYGLFCIMSTDTDIARNNAAQLLAAHIERARVDSSLRHPFRVEQLASVEVIDNKSYVVIVDGDQNGALDPPLKVTLPAGNLQFTGPFPKTFRFDSQGHVVDAENKVVPAPLVTLTNRNGTSTIRLSQSGKPIILTGIQAGIGTWK